VNEIALKVVQGHLERHVTCSVVSETSVVTSCSICRHCPAVFESTHTHAHTNNYIQGRFAQWPM